MYCYVNYYYSIRLWKRGKLVERYFLVLRKVTITTAIKAAAAIAKVNKNTTAINSNSTAAYNANRSNSGNSNKQQLHVGKEIRSSYKHSNSQPLVGTKRTFAISIAGSNANAKNSKKKYFD